MQVKKKLKKEYAGNLVGPYSIKWRIQSYTNIFERATCDWGGVACIQSLVY